MDKIHYQTDQEDLLRLCDGQMFTLYDDNIKSAASDTFTKEMLREYAPDKDHFMLHVVAMGDQETYGPNKNGDGFPKEALEKYHPTFISDGCFFREHRNRCQQTQGIGSIKASAYNPKMRRAELIVHGSKERQLKNMKWLSPVRLCLLVCLAASLMTFATAAKRKLHHLLITVII